MAWITPKTDFTADDYYNYSDFNRVENNTNYLRDYLISLGYKVPLIEIKTNRDNINIDFLSSMNRIEDNIEVIKNTFIKSSEHLNKAWTLGLGFSYLDANRLEENLRYLKYYSERVPDSYIYCGTINCGEGGTL